MGSPGPRSAADGPTLDQPPPPTSGRAAADATRAKSTAPAARARTEIGAWAARQRRSALGPPGSGSALDDDVV